jgi:hypothetical protein
VSARGDGVRKLGQLLAWSAAVVRPGEGGRLDVNEALERQRRRDRTRPSDH